MTNGLREGIPATQELNWPHASPEQRDVAHVAFCRITKSAIWPMYAARVPGMYTLLHFRTNELRENQFVRAASDHWG